MNGVVAAIRWGSVRGKPAVRGSTIRIILALAALGSSSLALEAGRRWH